MTEAILLGKPGLVCALGNGVDECAQALFATSVPGTLVRDESLIPGRALHLGWVRGTLSAPAALPLPHRSRNNTLLFAALMQIQSEVDAAIATFGPQRVGVVIGTSTSGIGESEHALRHARFPPHYHYAQQEMGSPAVFARDYLGLSAPAYVVSTACSSGAKALTAAARMLKAGLADAVIAGGADSLCAFTVAGFSALESVDAERCNPFSQNRRGINIGEGAAVFVLRRDRGEVRLAGGGESSDAHHMSAPEASGAGAAAAILAALERAALKPADIDYINLHGTATPLNDAMEARALANCGLASVPASSTKPLSGHALGAAGAIEAAFAWICLAANPEHRLPPHWWDGEADPALPSLALVRPGQAANAPLRRVLSTSFAFGGSNAALVLERS